MDALAFTSAKASLLQDHQQQTLPPQSPLKLAFHSARATLHHGSPSTVTTTTFEHTFFLTIRGLVHHRETGALAALTLPAPALLRLEREASNEFDPNAIAVLVVEADGSSKKLGYVAKEEAACLAPFLEKEEGSEDAAPPVHVERVELRMLPPPPSPAPMEEEEPTVVAIKPDTDTSSPMPTSVTIQVTVRTQQEGVYMALRQAFPPPAPAASDMDDDEAAAAAAAAAAEQEKQEQEQERVLELLAAACAKAEKEGRSGLRVLSLFDGIGAALVSLLQEECPIALYASSEVDANALQVMETHFPAFKPDDNEQRLSVLHLPLGDVRSIDARMLQLLRPDLLIGGSPCQDLSRLNERGKGLDGPRSKLFFEFIRVRDLCLQQADGGPLVMMLENVVPREEAQVQAINAHMQLAPLRLNASEVSAASRDRLYWTNLHVYGLKPTAGTDAVLADVLVSGRPAYHLYHNVAADGKALCIVRTPHRDWNLIEDPEQPAALAAHSRYRPLLPEEEERLMGFDDGYTSANGLLTHEQRHELLGNSFSIPVVRQILKRLKPLAQAQTAAERKEAVEGMKLLPLGSAVAMRACDACYSRVCVCT